MGLMEGRFPAIRYLAGMRLRLMRRVRKAEGRGGGAAGQGRGRHVLLLVGHDESRVSPGDAGRATPGAAPGAAPGLPAEEEVLSEAGRGVSQVSDTIVRSRGQEAWV
ncbi:hypothetical protein GCM10010339_77570 [Streptomyces alanosinicus]|uniref:Uncharacterized protein n=1 Tax=Streptomyces alanosinicus TaxID=68171 RepID=A0A918YR20_9ACTN|nr:hypothetical protein GCM10010339_77570 [Streptomyces alanosinicus]